MNKSPSIAKISEALSKAQGEMPFVKMDAQNPFLKNKYATLGAVIEPSKPVLSKFGLSVIQSPVSDGDKIGITTLIAHTSGEWLEDTIFISTAESKGLSTAQNAGVVISYLRRYSLQAFLNMYADEDTDAHKEQKAEPTEQKRKANAMRTLSDLKLRADKVKVQVAPMDAGWSIEKMTAHYKEQLEHIKQAEAQAEVK